ncbi:hypothetical protein [Serratia sp. Tan611]|uniref:hypothetical protein n=1 Tax=Serratia sp. Tan611 TaxID=2773264 RepID=UPI00193493C7|nr:hypothetical protein [Serratia sp. Tan611]CAE1150453.1 conserved protein of unknown function [Serratia sp. Tan611]
MKKNTLDALTESISNSGKIIINNILMEERKEIRLNLVYITYDFSSRCVLIEYYAEDNEYPDVEMKFDDLIDFVKK